MEDLTNQKPFFQLLSFLKDPDKHTFTRTGDKRFSPIWSVEFPTLNLEDIIYLPGKERHNAGMVHEFRQEAIEIMNSDMFRNGLLKGNQKTPDIEIAHIEEFVLPMAAVIHLAKGYIAKSLPEVRSHTFDGKLSVYDELRTAWHELLIAFDKVASIVPEGRLIQRLVGLNPRKRAAFEAQIKKLSNEGNWEEIDRILKKTAAGIRGELFVLQAESLAKAHLKEIKEMANSGFDVRDELIRIFLKIPEAPDLLIAGRIFEYFSISNNSSLTAVYPVASPDALRQRVKKQRRLAATPEIQ
jgi:hypothetical protein